MDDYFHTIPAHVQGHLDFDAIPHFSDSRPNLVSLGSDDLIIWRNTKTGESGTKQLQIDHGFTRISLHPDGDHFVVGGPSKRIFEFQLSQFSEKQPQLMHECLGTILYLKYSPSGRYISAATEEQKTIIIDRTTGKKTKCRPGHQNKIINTFFSFDERFVVSIGMDCMALVYELGSEPVEAYRTKICSQIPNSMTISGCFHKSPEFIRIYIPGLNELQEIDYINNRWQIKTTSIAHSSLIIACETLNENAIATSCSRDVCIWSLDNYEKLIALEEFPLLKMVSIRETFLGSRNDGALYQYNRPLPKATQMDVEDENESQINFDDGDKNQVKPEDEEDDDQYESEPHIQYVSSKKSKADRVIMVLPQAPLTRNTQFFDDYRFLHTTLQGYIVESREIDDNMVSVEWQHRSGDYTKNQIKNILKNKDKQTQHRRYRYFAMNSQVVAYASQADFGVIIDRFTSWDRTWADIQGIALGGNWLAVANISQINFYDLSGNQIKSICFDRVIVSMEAYENFLLVAYHQSIPMWKSQNIAMNLYNVTEFNVLSLSRCHVPVSPECFLRWLGFSKEGMLFSQDSFGALRVYSLQTNQWTSVLADKNVDPRKIWIIGIKNYQLVYWKTTDSDPEPTVRPRLNLKTSPISMATLENFESKEELQNYPNLLWERYVLDHEKARWRIWGRHKRSRTPQNTNFQLSESIMNEKQIQGRNLALDRKFYAIIRYLRKNDQIQRAVNVVKSCVRSIEVIQDLMEYFDDEGLRTEGAIELQNFLDEKKREIEYETMHELRLNELKKKASVEIKPQKSNPMNPKNRKPIKDPLPPLSLSQNSQNSISLQEVSHHSVDDCKQGDPVMENPFIKKKIANDNARKQQIEEHIEKFGVVKKKAEERRRQKRG